METTNRGYIYLLQLTNEKGDKVYKIGKAEEIESRLKAYKFKKILFSILINDYEEKERYLITLIKNKYSIASGREFFYGNDTDNDDEIKIFFMNNIINNNNKIDKIILDHELYNYKKDIDEKLLKDYSNKIESLQKINDDKYNSMVDEMNNKNISLQKINDEKYNLMVYEMNNKIELLQKINNDKYNSIVNEMKNKIEYLENLNNDKYNLLIELNEKYNELQKQNNQLEEQNNQLQEQNNELNNKLIDNKTDEDIFIQEFEKKFEIKNGEDRDKYYIKSIRLNKWAIENNLSIYTSKCINKLLFKIYGIDTKDEKYYKYKKINGESISCLIGINEKNNSNDKLNNKDHDKPAYIQIFYKKPELFIDKEWKSEDLFKETQKYATDNFLSLNYTLTKFGLYMSRIFGNYKIKTNSFMKFRMPSKNEYLKIIYDADIDYYKYINNNF
jgi:hypothetical protein